MTLKNAPAKDALMALAQMGGYGFVFVEDSAALGASSASPTQPRTVSISFRGESYSIAINSTLLAAGLQGKKEGNMIFAGSNVLSKTFGAQLSKVYRLNQVSAGSAADYLANLGASVTKTNTITTSVTQGGDQNQPSGSPNSATTQSSSQTTVEAYGSSTGPLVGLRATTDSRLGTVTLIGDSAVMIIAEQYLRQLDLRQRQVALSVKILDVTLDNDSEIANSFAFRSGNNFIVNAQGRLLGAFGNSLPPTAAQFDQMAGGANSAKPITQTLRLGETNTLVPPLTAQPVNPGNVYDQDTFFNFVNATITSRSTKVLASPTLILSENQDEIKGGAEVSAALASAGGSGSGSSSGSSSSGSGSGLSGTEGGATIGRPRSNESFVTVGEQVITNYTVTNGTQGNGNSCQPSFGIAGLTFGARISKIDDNGFVTFTLSPQISATTRQQRVEGCGLIDILSIRRLDTGSSRVRDGQTLILTGVISDADSQLVSKWPILGDMPLIGQFFRSTNGGRKKRELVILVTPKILDDNEGGRFGYGYQPSTSQSRELMGASGY
jgi:type IV pilus assembly protein PilQ